ncbi:MAG: murein biosynthesis integral membrane protein MurJ [Acidiferrobacteraceae bacterium]
MSHKLLQSTAVTAGNTLLSRIAGLVRDILLASLMGASTNVSADAFYMAFRIPNFFRRIFGEGAFSQAFVPVYTEYHSQRSEQELRQFTAQMLGVFGGLLLLITIAGVLGAPWLVRVIAYGYTSDPEKFALTVTILRITFPYLMFISLVAMAAGILNSHRRFAAAAFTPVLLNLCLIAAALWLAPRMGQPALALGWGVLVAGVIQLLFQFPFLLRLRMLVWPSFRGGVGVVRVFRQMGPAIFGSSVSQINIVVNSILASFLVTGSVTWLYYSDRLVQLPFGVFGIALATVILPGLSQEHAEKSEKNFSDMLDWALRWVALIMVPATVGLAVLAEPIVATLFQHGNFNATDVVMTGRAVIAFAIGLVGLVLVKVLAPGFYARHDTATPARVAAAAFLANIVLSIGLVFPLKHVGLALAISLSAYLNAVALFVILRRRNIYRPGPGWAAVIARIVVASAIMGVVLSYGKGEVAAWLNAALWDRVFRLTLWIGIGIGVYFVSVLILGMRPAHLRWQEVQRS